MTTTPLATTAETIDLGAARLMLEIENGLLCSLGRLEIGGVELRNSATRWIPWFDSLEGEVFRRFEHRGIEQRGETTIIRTRAMSDPDTLFRERRDVSGDLCFKGTSWDSEPVEADFDICIEPAEATVDGRFFQGIRYWFEYSGNIPIHRIVDRQTWELGGNLDDVTVVCRNWLTRTAIKLQKDMLYSTVGLDQWAPLLPGSLWGRWSLLPAFDMQYGAPGVFLGWFDEVSLIRSALESNTGEDSLRVLDVHFFEQGTTARTNPKNILHCPDELDATDALNLWTRVHDAEAEKVFRQFNLPREAAPEILIADNVWQNINFATRYEHAVAVAAEFGADTVFIDSVWEHHQALQQELDQAVTPEPGSMMDKFKHHNMCCTLDFKVAEVLGGEAGLKALCDRAAAQDVKIISWMAAHLSPFATCNVEELGTGMGGVYAMKESGRHPDTGYPNACWPINLNAPIGDYMQQNVIDVCKRTGLAGYLWDSFCNLGWWQLDYSAGTMRPQFDRMTEIYAAYVNAGLYIVPEAIVAFSSHSWLGQHGGEIYDDGALGYSYDSHIGLSYPDTEFLTGQRPVEELFEMFAHKRLAPFHFHRVDRAEWNEEATAQLKQLFAAYKKCRAQMQRRTVLKDNRGVLWEADGGASVLWSFQNQPAPAGASSITDLFSGEPVSGELLAHRVYVF